MPRTTDTCAAAWRRGWAAPGGRRRRGRSFWAEGGTRDMGAGAAGNGMARLDPQPSVRVPDRAAPTCPCKQVSDQPAARRSK